MRGHRIFGRLFHAGDRKDFAGPGGENFAYSKSVDRKYVGCCNGDGQGRCASTLVQTVNTTLAWSFSKLRLENKMVQKYKIIIDRDDTFGMKNEGISQVNVFRSIKKEFGFHSDFSIKNLTLKMCEFLVRLLWRYGPAFGIWASGLFLPTLAIAQWSASFRISNQVLVSPNVYEYDVFLQNTSPQSFRLHSYQFGVGIDTAVLNGGSLQVQYVDSSCQLTNMSQAPFWQFDSSTSTVFTNINVGTAVHVLSGRSYRFINNTSILPPLYVQASVVPASVAGCPQPGVRIGRFRAVNSVAFGRGSRPFHLFAPSNAAGMTQSVVSLFVTPNTQQFLYPNAANNALTLVNWNSTMGVCDVNPMFNCRDSVSVVASVCSPNSFLMGGVSYANSGNYQATLVNSLGCDSLVSLNLVVVTPPNPGVILGGDSLCVGVGATYTVGVAGGIWSSSDTSLLRIDPILGQVVAVAPGTVMVRYTVGANGSCGPVSTVKMVVVVAPPSVGLISGSDSACVGSVGNYSTISTGGIWSSSDTTVLQIHPVTGQALAIAPGSTLVSYSLGGGAVCGTVSSVKPVVVTAPPVIGPISGSDSVCVGSLVNYSSPTAGGTWFSSDTSILSIHPTSGVAEARANGTVFLNYAISGFGGCAPVIGTKIIAVLQLPSPPVLTRSVNSDTLFANTTLGNRWYRNGVLMPLYNDLGFIRVLGNGGYRCISRNLYGCESDSSNLQLILTSGNTNPVLYPLKVFPNPNSGKFSIYFDCGHLGISEIRLLDVLGRKVKIIETLTNSTNCLRDIEVAGWGSGLYYLSVIFTTGSGEILPIIIR